MPRFSDSWVVDKVMYTHVSSSGGASCLCCGANGNGGLLGSSGRQSLFLFSDGTGFEGIVNAMSDLDTQEDIDHEICAANVTPWPEELRDKIWCDRLSLRFKMKRERRKYRAFFQSLLEEANANSSSQIDHIIMRTNEEENDQSTLSAVSLNPDINNIGNDVVLSNVVLLPILRNLCRDALSHAQLCHIFRPTSPSDLMDMVRKKYKIGHDFSVVLSTVMDQVANFKTTGYGMDAPACEHRNHRHPSGCDDTFTEEEDGSFNDYEEKFEKQLKFDNGCFVLDVANGWTINDEVLMVFLRYMTTFASHTTLLSRTASGNSSQEVDRCDSEKNHVVESSSSRNSNCIIKQTPTVPSFRSDRRVIRLLIARYWADRLIEQYNVVRKETVDSTRNSQHN